MAGLFIMSLDCEGKWGMADRLTAHHHRHVTRANLGSTYRWLIELCARYDVPATFAFVTAFVLTEEERHRHSQRFRNVPVDGRNWLRLYRKAEAAGDLDGWFCPEALEMVAEHPEHDREPRLLSSSAAREHGRSRRRRGGASQRARGGA